MIPFLIGTAGAVEVSYEDALRMAEEANPSIAGARQDLSIAEGGLFSARGVWDPVLTSGAGRAFSTSEQRDPAFGLYYQTTTTNLWWNAGLGQTLPTGTSWSVDWENSRNDFAVELDPDSPFQVEDFAAGSSSLTASLSQELLKGHRMAYNLQAVTTAQNAVDSADAALHEKRQSVLSDVAVAYWDLVYAGQFLETSREAVAVAKEERRIVRAQLEAGNMAPVELTRVEAAVAQTELALIEAENLHASSQAKLATLLALDTMTVSVTTLPGDIPPLAIDMDKAIEATMAGNPGLRAQRIQIDAAATELVVARHAQLPSLTASASAGWSGYNDEVGGGYPLARQEVFGRDFPNRYVGADFSVPLMNRAARGDLRTKAAGVTRAEIDLRAMETALAGQVARLVRELETSQRRLELAELNLRLAEETLLAEKALQEAGRAIQKDVLAAQRERDAAEVEVTKARTDYRKALVQLEGLQGRL
ncbi:MAG TPA: TolC family protein [Myxococcota bacterium]|nr:TolC family protein [Myxococcota bacterium]